MTEAPDGKHAVGGKHAVLIGAGNIGSHASRLLARTPGIARLTVIDRDDYERANLASQDVREDDVGCSKAIAQARRLGRVRSGLDVEAVVGAVENVPMARLRADMLLAAVDNNRARQVINEISLRLGVPWIDAAVEPDSLLARVNVFLPGRDRPCLECAWDDRDYERLGAVNRPCDRGGAEAPRATSSPSALGSLAASLAVIEAQKLLAGERDTIAPGQQVLLDAEHHQYYRTTSRRNRDCRLGDHAAWTIRDLPAALPRSLRWLFARAAETAGGARVSLGVVGHPFVRSLVCPTCGRRRAVLRVETALTRGQRACKRCAASGDLRASIEIAPMEIVGFDLADDLALDSVSNSELESSLEAIGLRAGDVLRLTTDAGEVHRVAVTGDPRSP